MNQKSSNQKEGIPKKGKGQDKLDWTTLAIITIAILLVSYGTFLDHMAYKDAKNMCENKGMVYDNHDPVTGNVVCKNIKQFDINDENLQVVNCRMEWEGVIKVTTTDESINEVRIDVR